MANERYLQIKSYDAQKQLAEFLNSYEELDANDMLVEGWDALSYKTRDRLVHDWPEGFDFDNFLDLYNETYGYTL